MINISTTADDPSQSLKQMEFELHRLDACLKENPSPAIKAVLDGVGVAVAQLPYVSDALATGRLVAPFPVVRKKYESWYLAYRPVRQADPALALFRDWLHGEAELQRREYERLMSRD